MDEERLSTTDAWAGLEPWTVALTPRVQLHFEICFAFILSIVICVSYVCNYLINFQATHSSITQTSNFYTFCRVFIDQTGCGHHEAISGGKTFAKPVQNTSQKCSQANSLQVYYRHPLLNMYHDKIIFKYYKLPYIKILLNVHFNGY